MNLTFLAPFSTCVPDLWYNVINVIGPLLYTSGAGNNSCKLVRNNSGHGLLSICNLSSDV